MARKVVRKERGVFEKVPGSDIWWIRFKVDGVDRSLASHVFACSKRLGTLAKVEERRLESRFRGPLKGTLGHRPIRRTLIAKCGEVELNEGLV